jgi:hypothetical protein
MLLYCGTNRLASELKESRSESRIVSLVAVPWWQIDAVSFIAATSISLVYVLGIGSWTNGVLRHSFTCMSTGRRIYGVSGGKSQVFAYWWEQWFLVDMWRQDCGVLIINFSLCKSFPYFARNCAKWFLLHPLRAVFYLCLVLGVLRVANHRRKAESQSHEKLFKCKREWCGKEYYTRSRVSAEARQRLRAALKVDGRNQRATLQWRKTCQNCHSQDISM